MDTEVLLEILSRRPGSTVRDLLPLLRKAGLSIDRSTLNSALYTMLRLGTVERHESTDGGPPRWRVVDQGQLFPTKPLVLSDRGVERVLERCLSDGTQLTVLERPDSPNDPYVDVEIFDGKVVATINVLHPIWMAAGDNEAVRTFIRASAAAEALVLARLRERPGLDPARHVALRDAYLREIVLQSVKDSVY